MVGHRSTNRCEFSECKFYDGMQWVDLDLEPPLDSIKPINSDPAEFEWKAEPSSANWNSFEIWDEHPLNP